MDRTRGRIAAAAGFCLFLALVLFATAAVVYGIAGDKALMAAEMRRHAPPKVSGLPEEQYGGMGQMIAEYLTGKRDVFQYSFSGDDGNEVVCFQSHEADHMADCQSLIRLAAKLRLYLAGISLMMLAAGLLLRKQRKSYAAGMITGFSLTAAVGVLVLVWGMISFDSLFIAFHRVFFTNEGWLLDARTDMLIRLMPTSFFISLGMKVLLGTAAMVLAALGAAVILRTAGKRNSRQNTDQTCET